MIDWKSTFKNVNWKTVGIVAAVIVVCLFVWRETHWKNRYREDTGALNMVVEIEKKTVKKNEAAIQDLNRELSQEKEGRLKDRQAAEARISKLLADNIKLSADNEAYKKSLKEFTDDKIVQEIGRRIGAENVALMAIGKFSLTRIGGERTAGLFADGEFNLAQYKNTSAAFTLAMEGWDKERKSFEGSLKKSDGKFILKSEEWQKCMDSSTAKDKTIKDLKHRISWKNIEAWGERILVIILGAKAFGAIK